MKHIYSLFACSKRPNNLLSRIAYAKLSLLPYFCKREMTYYRLNTATSPQALYTVFCPKTSGALDLHGINDRQRVGATAGRGVGRHLSEHYRIPIKKGRPLCVETLNETYTPFRGFQRRLRFRVFSSCFWILRVGVLKRRFRFGATIWANFAVVTFGGGAVVPLYSKNPMA